MASSKTEIQSAAIARGTDKVTHEHFYVVKSDSSDRWYEVRWQVNAWSCNCAAHCQCKHVRAVNEILRIRRATIALAMGGQVPAIVAKLQAREDAKLAEQAARREAYVAEFGIYE
jgi:hypothetical protein